MKNNETKNQQILDFVDALDGEQQKLLEQAYKASRKRPASRVSRKLMGVLAAFAILVGGSVAVWAAVDDDWGTSDLLTGGVIVPYDGFLMLGSDAANGTRDVTFELWDDEASTDPGNLIWSETQTVDFFNGRFSVGLGNGSQTSAKSIDQAILDGEQLYLAVQVKDNSDAWVALAGRQAIEAVPYSAWSANAADFTVNGDLTATSGTTTVGILNTTGNAGVTGTLDIKNKIGSDTSHSDNFNLWVQGSDTSVSAGDNRNLALLGTSETYTDNEDLLYVNYSGAYSGGLILDSNTTVDGDLTITGNLTVSDSFSNFTISSKYEAQAVLNTGNDTLTKWSDYVEMTPSESSICFINYHYNKIDEDTDGHVINACEITKSDGIWKLRAYAEKERNNQGVGADCWARCLSW